MSRSFRCGRALLFALALGVASCATGPRPAPPLAPDAVLGLWKCYRNGASVRIERRGDAYVMLGVADRRGEIPKPDVIGEFRADSAQPGFVGRHVWGGRWGTNKDEPLLWGEDGELKVRQVTNDEILIRYLDSRHTDGWTYKRLR